MNLHKYQLRKEISLWMKRSIEAKHLLQKAMHPPLSPISNELQESDRDKNCSSPCSWNNSWRDKIFSFSMLHLLMILLKFNSSLQRRYLQTLTQSFTELQCLSSQFLDTIEQTHRFHSYHLFIHKGSTPISSFQKLRP